MSRYIVVSESRIDLKYKRIESKNYIQGNLRQAYKILFAGNKCIFHVRYLQKGTWLTVIFKYIVGLLVFRVLGGRIVFTLHNIGSHNLEKRKGNLVRLYVSSLAHSIIVFDEGMLRYMWNIHRRKTIVSSFGYMSVEDLPNDESSKCLNDFKAWLELDTKTPLALYASSAKLHVDIEFMLSQLSQYRVVIVGLSNLDIPNDRSLYVYNGQSYGITRYLLNNIPQRTIGVLGSCNISVPTSLYLYLSYSLPLKLVGTNPIMKLIVERYGLSSDNTPEERAIGVNLFFQDNSWKRFMNDHMKIFC